MVLCGQLYFKLPAFLHDFYANARYMPQYAYFLILFPLSVFVFTVICFPSPTTTFLHLSYAFAGKLVRSSCIVQEYARRKQLVG